MKKFKIAIILLIVITIAASAYIFAYSVYGYTIAEDYTAVIIYSFGRTGTELPIYRKLDSKFQNEIPSELRPEFFSKAFGKING